MRHQLDTFVSMALLAKRFEEEAFREVLAWKGATLVRQRQMRKVADDEAIAPLFAKLQQTVTRLATLVRAVPEPKKQEVWRRQITDLSAEKERLEVELSRQIAVFRETKKRITLEDLMAALPRDAVLVDVLSARIDTSSKKDGKPSETTRQRRLVAFVVQHDKPVALVDLGAVAPFSEAIDTWRVTFGMSPDGAAAGQLLRKRIWEPLEPLLGNTKTVLISPDGVLGRLPIAALPGKKAGTYLLEEYRLATVPVPQLLPAMVSELGRKELKGLLIMGDVDYGAKPGKAKKTRNSMERSSNTSMVRGGSTFSSLTVTAGEITSIKELFTDLFEPSAEEIGILKQSDATEEAFRRLSPRFYTLHLATHGFFADPSKRSALRDDSDNRLQLASDRKAAVRGFHPGLLSGLAFAGANGTTKPDADDGILTSDEISTLGLDGVDLVVLSACETGLGEVDGGEGLIGIQRAFQVAGSRTTIASLWNMDDLATRRLMETFYRNYWEKKMSKLDALRATQLWLLNHPAVIRGGHSEAIRGARRLNQAKQDSKRLSPRYWAAFVLSGDWR